MAGEFGLKNSTGERLLCSDGKQAIGCCAEELEECPTDCTDCDDPYTVSYSGSFTAIFDCGAGGSTDLTDDFEPYFTMDHDASKVTGADDCDWQNFLDQYDLEDPIEVTICPDTQTHEYDRVYVTTQIGCSDIGSVTWQVARTVTLENTSTGQQIANITLIQERTATSSCPAIGAYTTTVLLTGSVLGPGSLDTGASTIDGLQVST